MTFNRTGERARTVHLLGSAACSHLDLYEIVGFYNRRLASLCRSPARSARGLLVTLTGETGVRREPDDSLATGTELALRTHYPDVPYGVQTHEGIDLLAN